VDGQAGELLQLPDGSTARLLVPYPGSARLWVALVEGDVPRLLERYGRPIAYPYVRGQWPLAAYQTVYAATPGSAEMPSAGRPFTPDVLEQLAHRGIEFQTLTLHTGVASLEGHETPYAEEYWVPARTAAAVRAARAEGRRVIAVGTPERGVRAVDGLLTGFHEPRASHLAMLEAIAGRPHLQKAYAAALEARYLWHEFGDVHLILR
jgi:S-adenosylmethionine:tRNA ribosyltransferase-isomerase